ncbi:hypothetical protein ADUPG1_007052, partial [Aduncisulcus paluster]
MNICIENVFHIILSPEEVFTKEYKVLGLEFLLRSLESTDDILLNSLLHKMCDCGIFYGQKVADMRYSSRFCQVLSQIILTTQTPQTLIYACAVLSITARNASSDCTSYIVSALNALLPIVDSISLSLLYQNYTHKHVSFMILPYFSAFALLLRECPQIHPIVEQSTAILDRLFSFSAQSHKDSGGSKPLDTSDDQSGRPQRPSSTASVSSTSSASSHSGHSHSLSSQLLHVSFAISAISPVSSIGIRDRVIRLFIPGARRLLDRGSDELQHILGEDPSQSMLSPFSHHLLATLLMNRMSLNLFFSSINPLVSQNLLGIVREQERGVSGAYSFHHDTASSSGSSVGSDYGLAVTSGSNTGSLRKSSFSSILSSSPSSSMSSSISVFEQGDIDESIIILRTILKAQRDKLREKKRVEENMDSLAMSSTKTSATQLKTKPRRSSRSFRGSFSRFSTVKRGRDDTLTNRTFGIIKTLINTITRPQLTPNSKVSEDGSIRASTPPLIGGSSSTSMDKQGSGMTGGSFLTTVKPRNITVTPASDIVLSSCTSQQEEEFRSTQVERYRNSVEKARREWESTTIESSRRKGKDKTTDSTGLSHSSSSFVSDVSHSFLPLSSPLPFSPPLGSFSVTNNHSHPICLFFALNPPGFFFCDPAFSIILPGQNVTVNIHGLSVSVICSIQERERWNLGAYEDSYLPQSSTDSLSVEEAEEIWNFGKSISKSKNRPKTPQSETDSDIPNDSISMSDDLSDFIDASRIGQDESKTDKYDKKNIKYLQKLGERFVFSKHNPSSGISIPNISSSSQNPNIASYSSYNSNINPSSTSLPSSFLPLSLRCELKVRSVYGYTIRTVPVRFSTSEVIPLFPVIPVVERRNRKATQKHSTGKSSDPSRPLFPFPRYAVFYNGSSDVIVMRVRWIELIDGMMQHSQDGYSPSSSARSDLESEIENSDSEKHRTGTISSKDISTKYTDTTHRASGMDGKDIKTPDKGIFGFITCPPHGLSVCVIPPGLPLLMRVIAEHPDAPQISVTFLKDDSVTELDTGLDIQYGNVQLSPASKPSQLGSLSMIKTRKRLCVFDSGLGLRISSRNVNTQPYLINASSFTLFSLSSKQHLKHPRAIQALLEAAKKDIIDKNQLVKAGSLSNNTVPSSSLYSPSFSPFHPRAIQALLEAAKKDIIDKNQLVKAGSLSNNTVPSSSLYSPSFSPFVEIFDKYFGSFSESNNSGVSSSKKSSSFLSKTHIKSYLHFILPSILPQNVSFLSSSLNFPVFKPVPISVPMKCLHPTSFFSFGRVFVSGLFHISTPTCLGISPTTVKIPLISSTPNLYLNVVLALVGCPKDIHMYIQRRSKLSRMKSTGMLSQSVSVSKRSPKIDPFSKKKTLSPIIHGGKQTELIEDEIEENEISTSSDYRDQRREEDEEEEEGIIFNFVCNCLLTLVHLSVSSHPLNQLRDKETSNGDDSSPIFSQLSSLSHLELLERSNSLCEDRVGGLIGARCGICVVGLLDGDSFSHISNSILPSILKPSISTPGSSANPMSSSSSKKFSSKSKIPEAALLGACFLKFGTNGKRFSSLTSSLMPMNVKPSSASIYTSSTPSSSPSKSIIAVKNKSESSQSPSHIGSARESDALSTSKEPEKKSTTGGSMISQSLSMTIEGTGTTVADSFFLVVTSKLKHKQKFSLMATPPLILAQNSVTLLAEASRKIQVTIDTKILPCVWKSLDALIKSCVNSMRMTVDTLKKQNQMFSDKNMNQTTQTRKSMSSITSPAPFFRLGSGMSFIAIQAEGKKKSPSIVVPVEWNGNSRVSIWRKEEMKAFSKYSRKEVSSLFSEKYTSPTSSSSSASSMVSKGSPIVNSNLISLKQFLASSIFFMSSIPRVPISQVITIRNTTDRPIIVRISLKPGQILEKLLDVSLSLKPSLVISNYSSNLPFFLPYKASSSKNESATWSFKLPLLSIPPFSAAPVLFSFLSMERINLQGQIQVSVCDSYETSQKIRQLREGERKKKRDSSSSRDLSLASTMQNGLLFDIPIGDDSEELDVVCICGCTGLRKFTLSASHSLFKRYDPSLPIHDRRERLFVELDVVCICGCTGLRWSTNIIDFGVVSPGSSLSLQVTLYSNVTIPVSLFMIGERDFCAQTDYSTGYHSKGRGSTEIQSTTTINIPQGKPSSGSNSPFIICSPHGVTVTLTFSPSSSHCCTAELYATVGEEIVDICLKGVSYPKQIDATIPAMLLNTSFSTSELLKHSHQNEDLPSESYNTIAHVDTSHVSKRVVPLRDLQNGELVRMKPLHVTSFKGNYVLVPVSMCLRSVSSVQLAVSFGGKGSHDSGSMGKKRAFSEEYDDSKGGETDGMNGHGTDEYEDEEYEEESSVSFFSGEEISGDEEEKGIERVQAIYSTQLGKTTNVVERIVKLGRMILVQHMNSESMLIDTIGTQTDVWVSKEDEHQELGKDKNNDPSHEVESPSLFPMRVENTFKMHSGEDVLKPLGTETISLQFNPWDYVIVFFLIRFNDEQQDLVENAAHDGYFHGDLTRGLPKEDISVQFDISLKCFSGSDTFHIVVPVQVSSVLSPDIHLCRFSPIRSGNHASMDFRIDNKSWKDAIDVEEQHRRALYTHQDSKTQEHTQEVNDEDDTADKQLVSLSKKVTATSSKPCYVSFAHLPFHAELTPSLERVNVSVSDVFPNSYERIGWIRTRLGCLFWVNILQVVGPRVEIINDTRTRLSGGSLVYSHVRQSTKALRRASSKLLPSSSLSLSSSPSSVGEVANPQFYSVRQMSASEQAFQVPSTTVYILSAIHQNSLSFDLAFYNPTTVSLNFWFSSTDSESSFIQDSDDIPVLNIDRYKRGGSNKKVNIILPTEKISLEPKKTVYHRITMQFAKVGIFKENYDLCCLASDGIGGIRRINVCFSGLVGTPNLHTQPRLHLGHVISGVTNHRKLTIHNRAPNDVYVSLSCPNKSVDIFPKYQLIRGIGSERSEGGMIVSSSSLSARKVAGSVTSTHGAFTISILPATRDDQTTASSTDRSLEQGNGDDLNLILPISVNLYGYSTPMIVSKVMAHGRIGFASLKIEPTHYSPESNIISFGVCVCGETVRRRVVLSNAGDCPLGYNSIVEQIEKGLQGADRDISDNEEESTSNHTHRSISGASSSPMIGHFDSYPPKGEIEGDSYVGVTVSFCGRLRGYDTKGILLKTKKGIGVSKEIQNSKKGGYMVELGYVHDRNHRNKDVNSHNNGEKQLQLASPRPKMSELFECYGELFVQTPVKSQSFILKAKVGFVHVIICFSILELEWRVRFGKVRVGTTVTRHIRLINIGNIPATVNIVPHGGRR